jgi:hypothetical protein
MYIDWLAVADGAKHTTQTIRALLDHNDIEYQLRNADEGAVVIVTRKFAVEVNGTGTATYADEGEHWYETEPPHMPFVLIKREDAADRDRIEKAGLTPQAFPLRPDVCIMPGCHRKKAPGRDVCRTDAAHLDTITEPEEG